MFLGSTLSFDISKLVEAKANVKTPLTKRNMLFSFYSWQSIRVCDVFLTIRSIFLKHSAVFHYKTDIFQRFNLFQRIVINGNDIGFHSGGDRAAGFFNSK